jgi:hypothetical protein
VYPPVIEQATPVAPTVSSTDGLLASCDFAILYVELAHTLLQLGFRNFGMRGSEWCLDISHDRAVTCHNPIYPVFTVILYDANKCFNYRKPTFISHFLLDCALHEIEVGVFCRKMIKEDFQLA